MRKCVSLEDWLHEVFQVNLSDMKHIAIALFVCSAILLGAGSSQAQLLARTDVVTKAVQVSRPSAMSPLTTSSSLVFLNPGKGENTPLNALAKVVQLAYFGDTSNGNLFLRFSGNDFFNILSPTAPPDSLTFYNFGYSERFTTTLAKPYLDSIQISLGIISMPTTNSLNFGVYHERQDTIRDRNTGQVLYILPGADQHSTQIASVNYPGTNVIQGQFQTLTVNFKHKALAVKDHSFFITADAGGPTPLDDSVIFMFDKNEQPQRDKDSTIDRCNIVFEDAGHLYFIEQNFAANWGSAADPTQLYYPNLLMTAYLSDPTAGVVESSAQPSAYRLAQNYPNPFNPSTEINYALPVLSKVSLKVYNALGMEVATVVNSTQKAGEHSVKFDASELPSGTYFYTLKAGSFTETRRMVLSK
jgi:hypothetical protein